MPMLRLALVQANPTVGDLAGNAEQARAAVAQAAAAGAQLVALPEMFLTGYPIEDLALRPSFQAASRATLEELARQLAADGHGALPVVVGYLDRSDDASDRLGRPRGGPVNSAAVLQHGSVVARYDKHHLPNYGVFDEFRYFVPGDQPCVLDIGGTDVALAICEDLWQEGGPVAEARGCGLLLVINGSPYERDKDDTRLELCQRRARELGATLAYVNMTGGQDELVFDGDSLVVGPDGGLLARSPAFRDDILVIDLDLPEATGQHARLDVPVMTTPVPLATIAEPLSDHATVWTALVTGLRDYVDKNRFPSVILGLSGGIDSALVAALACDAFGPDRVYGVALPSVYSSEHSLADAADLAERTGLHHRIIPIAPMVDAFDASLHLSGLAEENLQARVRGTTLMALSNAEGHLVLATGNKTEVSVGYSTIYGDAVGGFAPIKDVPKTLVWELARWRNAQAEAAGEVPPIPPNSIAKPPSAELRPGQLDQDSLPDYALLDDILDDYVDKNRFPSVILGLSGGIDSALVAALACDAFGPDRVYGVALPSVYSSEHSLADAADLAERTGLHYRVIPIAPMVDAFDASLHLSGLAEENLQARVRGTTLMALSNAEGHLVLATGNKTEVSVGYSTIYGDAVGGFAPIKDVPKTLVWELARWRNAQAETAGEVPPIPPNSIAKPPSAELRPGQLDQDSLPDYALLDDILDDYVEHDRGLADLVAQGFDSEVVARVIHLTDAAEYKRRQYPPGTKISLRAFGRDRRQPITNRWRD